MPRLVVDKDAVKDQAAIDQFVGDKGVNTVDVTVVEAQVVDHLLSDRAARRSDPLRNGGCWVPAQTGATGADDAEVGIIVSFHFLTLPLPKMGLRRTNVALRFKSAAMRSQKTRPMPVGFGLGTA